MKTTQRYATKFFVSSSPEYLRSHIFIRLPCSLFFIGLLDALTRNMPCRCRPYIVEFFQLAARLLVLKDPKIRKAVYQFLGGVNDELAKRVGQKAYQSLLETMLQSLVAQGGGATDELNLAPDVIPLNNGPDGLLNMNALKLGPGDFGNMIFNDDELSYNLSLPEESYDGDEFELMEEEELPLEIELRDEEEASIQAIKSFLDCCNTVW